MENNTTESTRQLKVAREIQREMAEIIRSKGMAAFEGALVSVSGVKISSDLSVAKIYVSIFPSAKADAVMGRLKENVRALRGELGRAMGKQLRIVQIHRIDGFNCLVQFALPLARVRVNTGEMLGTRVGHVLADGIECFEQFGIEFTEHFAHDLQAQIHVVLQRIRESTLFRAFGARAGRHDSGVGWRDLLIFCCH